MMLIPRRIMAIDLVHSSNCVSGTESIMMMIGSGCASCDDNITMWAFTKLRSSWGTLLASLKNEVPNDGWPHA
jgi:hypothetical protein